MSTHQSSVNSNKTVQKYEEFIYWNRFFLKRKFDISVFQADNLKRIHHNLFSNEADGYSSMLDWIYSLTDIPEDKWLFCGEHTGAYSIGLTRFLVSGNLFMWLETIIVLNVFEKRKRK